MNDTFKYGDACESGDDKYVVAQFRSNASLAWVSDLRSFLNLPELKYRDFHPRRHQVMSNAEIWAKFERGVQQAEITIVDPLFYRHAVLDDWLDQGAEEGIDFDLKMVNDSAGELLVLEFGDNAERLGRNLPDETVRASARVLKKGLTPPTL